jgi:hypothetical protein
MVLVLLTHPGACKKRAAAQMWNRPNARDVTQAVSALKVITELLVKKSVLPLMVN